LEPAERSRVVAALVAVQVFFAVHYVAAKLVLEAIPAPAWAAIRVGAAAATFLLVYLVRGPRPLGAREHAHLALLGVFGVVLNQVCFIEGLARTSPAHSALIMTTIPVLTTTFALALGRERTRRAALAGIALALGGVLVLLRVDALELRAEWVRGDLLTLANATSFSLFLVLSKGTVRKLGPATATTGFLCWGSLGTTLYGARALAAVDPLALPPRILALAAFIVVFPTVLAYFLNSWALARVDSSEVALFVYLQPILASALSVAVLGEPITPRLVLASILVFLGVLFATRDVGAGAAPRAAEPV
jgi:drug/metabolite transporter (DMT)-like permease